MKTMITQHISKGLRYALAAVGMMLAGISAQGQNYTIGTGTTQYSSTAYAPASPLGIYYPSMRVQYLYTAAELTAAGMPANTVIDQIAFNVGNTNGSGRAPGFNISTAWTTQTTLTSTTGWNTGTSNVYSNNSPGYQAVAGWNRFTLSSPITWNGTDNLVIDVCNARGASGVSGAVAGVYYNTISNRSIYASGNTAASYCGVNVVTPSNTTLRPNIQFTHLVPCNGVVKGATIPAGTVTGGCPGTQFTITDTGYSNSLGMSFQWMQSTNGGTSWQPAFGSGTNTPTMTTSPLVQTTRYHLVMCCSYSATCDSTADVIFNFTAGFPQYATLPFFEGFESWINGCGTSDLPSNKWTNQPYTGFASWRREDQSSTAGQYNAYTPPTAPEGLHSARYNGYYANANVTTGSPEGNLNLYLDCSGTTGNKELQFYYNFAYQYGTAPDSLNVDMSLNGGATWTNIAQFGYQPRAWNYITGVQIPSNSATTVIRFRAKAMLNYYDDIYIDAVRVLPSCSGTPVAGIVDSLFPCNGQPFTLQTSGTSLVAGLSYVWQYKPVGALGWANLPGGNVPRPTATITSDTWFRVYVTCANSNLTDTSAAVLGVIQPFYYCYCSYLPQSTTFYYNNIGNVKITSVADTNLVKLNNGNPLPTISNPTAILPYSDFRRRVPYGKLIRDSLYRITVQIITAQSSWYGQGYPACAWLDTNRDGVFQSNERILNKNVGTQAAPFAKDTFRIGRNAQVGITGLRVTHFPYYSAPVNPCGLYGYQGEIEDYLMYIEYQPCNGPVNPGLAYISDTAICPGYTVDMWDTSYEKTRTGIYRDWQMSTNNGASWSVIPGSAMKDTLFNVVIPRFNPTVFRLRATCTNSNDTTYSNVLRVVTPDPIRCYPVAQAVVGGRDSSDIGAFRLGEFINPVPPATAGPHLFNPAAHRRRTDYTLLGPIYLTADSPTRLSVFHTMPGGNHADALVSVFIDFNNNLQYEPMGSGVFPSELVYQGVTTGTNFFLDTTVVMPHNVIPNVRTGVRVVINNDLNPTSPGNTGVGTFSSGEVEDYIAMFGRVNLGVGGINNLQTLAMYPNPTDGKFTLESDASRPVSHLEVLVTTITGQQVLNRSFDGVGTHFSTALDLSGAAKGIYFVELRADGEKITRKLVIR